MRIAFMVNGVPVPFKRARKNGKRHFNDPAYTAWKTAAGHIAKTVMKDAGPIDGPVELTVSAFFPVPKSWTKLKQRRAYAGEIPHTSTPDVDNILKAVSDSLNGVAYLDDKQIISVRATKAYVMPEGLPRVGVVVEELMVEELL